MARLGLKSPQALGFCGGDWRSLPISAHLGPALQDLEITHATSSMLRWCMHRCMFGPGSACAC